MKHVFFVVGFFLPIFCIAQIPNPISAQSFNNWQGDTNLMIFENGWAKANDYDTSTSLTIWTPLQVQSSTEWEAEIKLEFNPSATNYLLFYLLADKPLNQSINQGYYVKIGGATGYADAIDLYKQNGSTHTKIISGKTGYIGQDLIHAQVKVQYYSNGTWRLFADSTATGNFTLQGEYVERITNPQGYTGFNFMHTSTRKDKFSFKSITITEAPLEILKVTATSPAALTISLSSDETLTIPANSILINGIAAASISQTENELYITLDQLIPEGENTLVINHESIQCAKTFIYSPIQETASIIFHEIMADPDPSLGLPEYEYVELSNNGNKAINLKNYTFADKTTTATISQDLIIQPDSFLLLCSIEAAEYFSLIGKTLGLNTWPTLNNETDYLQLRNESGILVDDIEYFKSWHTSTSKAEGGYALELINSKSRCSGKANWTTSASALGGTPGKANSINQTLSPNQLTLNSYQITTDSIKVIFIQDIFWPQQPQINFDNYIITDYKSNGTVLTFLSPYTLSPNTVYNLMISGQTDCLAQPLPDQNFELIIPVQPAKGELLINEILFNPKTGGTDFVEIYNHSDNYIDLSAVQIGYRSTANDSLITYHLSANHQLFQPRQFKILTKDSLKVVSQHTNAIQEAIFQLAKFPSLADTEGELQLINAVGILDQVWYHANQHSPIINDQNGVSLERISYTTPSTEPSNWHSAASTANYATPGFKNSQATTLTDSEKEFYIDPPIFSPDGDGYQDLAFFRYKLPREGWLANISIYDTQGRFVAEVANNQLLGTEGFLTWNGASNQGNIANIGMYFILIDLFHPGGETKKMKETLVIGAGR